MPCTWLMSTHSMRSGASGKPKRILNTLQRSTSRSEVTGALQLVLRQRVLRVALTVSASARLSPRCGTRSDTREPAQRRQPDLQLLGVSRQHRHQHLARHRVRRLVGRAVELGLIAVELREELFDQILRRGFARLTGLFDDPATLPADPPAADVEHLDRRFQFVVGEGDHVGVGAVTEHHRLLLQRPPQRRDVVAQPRGPFEIQLLGGVVHLLFHLADQPVGLARQEIAEVHHDRAGALRR